MDYETFPHDDDGETLAGELSSSTALVPVTPAAPAADEPEQAAVPPLTWISVSCDLVRAALSCSSKEDTRYYLKGVHLSATKDGDIRIAATDGHRLFIATEPAGENGCPDWLQGDGVILPADILKPRLSLIQAEGKASEKWAGPATARIAYAPGAPRAEVSDPLDTMTFRMSLIDGQFPDLSGILANLSGNLGDRQAEALDATSFDTGYLKAAGEMGKLLGVKTISYLPGPASQDPALFTFPEKPAAMLILMPMRISTPAATPINGQLAKVLAPALRGTVAALRAHLTRTEEALKKCRDEGDRSALSARAEHYRNRIASILEAVEGPTLAAPEAEEAPAPETGEPAQDGAEADVETADRRQTAFDLGDVTEPPAEDGDGRMAAALAALDDGELTEAEIEEATADLPEPEAQATAEEPAPEPTTRRGRRNRRGR